MKKSILFKTILLITVFSLITSVYLVLNLRNSYTEEKIAELKSYTSFVEKVLNEDKYDKLDTYLEPFHNNNVRITVIMESGEVRYDSEEDYRLMTNNANREEVITALEEGEGISKRFSNTLKKEMLYYGKYYKKNKEAL